MCEELGSTIIKNDIFPFVLWDGGDAFLRAPGTR